MDCSCFTLLLGYAITLTIAFIISVSLYASCGSIPATQEVVAGDEKKVSVNKFDILSVDNSVLNETTGDQCNCFELVGFTVLEMLVMAILAFGVIMGLFKLAAYLKNKMIKQKEARKSFKQQKALEMRRKIEQEFQQTIAKSADLGEPAGTNQRSFNACAVETSGKLEYP
jgi:hypothetical protein